MKIVFLKSRLSFKGGLEKYTLHLAKHFALKGHDVTILTTGPVALPPISSIKIISLGKSSKFTLYHLFHFDTLCKKWLKHHSYPIIFGMERTSYQTHYRAGSGVHAVFLKQRFKVDSFLKKLTLLFNPLHLYLLYLERKAFENTDLKRLFVNSHMVRQEILNYYNVDPEKIEVVYNGVALPELTFSYEKKDPCLHFLFVGNGYKRKGLAFLLPVLATLKDRNFHLSIVGKEKNLAYFRNSVDDLQLGEKISFHGSVDNLDAFYEKSDVLLLPTLYDPFANVTVEALAKGLFIITSRYNGASEILTKESGYIIENLLDFESVKKAILVGLNKHKTKNSAISIRNTIKELEFSKALDKIVEKTIETLF